MMGIRRLDRTETISNIVFVMVDRVLQAGVKLFIGSKVPCMFCVEICTPEGRGGEKEGSGVPISEQSTQNL